MLKKQFFPLFKFKIPLYLFLVTMLPGYLCAQGKNTGNAHTYTNPLPVAFGDPYILFDKASGKYYMYGTGGGAKDGFGTYSSKDLVNWQNEGQVYFGNKKGAWGVRDFWAPEVYQYKNKYYLFYSAHWGYNPANELENYKIGVAVADRPTGPFTDLIDKPLFDPGYPIIDANVYFDPSGKLFLYYSRCCYKNPVKSEVADWAKEKGWFNEIEESWVYGVELKPDFSGTIGKPVLLLRPPLKMNDPQAEWESRSVTSKEVNRRWTEGSYTFRKGNTYYMMYSANFFGGENYAIGYATAKHPLGPFKKAGNNPVLQKNTGQGGGRNRHRPQQRPLLPRRETDVLRLSRQNPCFGRQKGCIYRPDAHQY